MLTQIKNKSFINLLFYFTLGSIFILIIMFFFLTQQMKFPKFQFFDISNIKTNQSNSSLQNRIFLNNLKFINNNTNRQTPETKIKCVGSLYNQSCLFENLYYVDSAFMILTVKGTDLPNFSVRTSAFSYWNTTPKKRVFNSIYELEKFVRTVINPKIIPSVTVYFGQPWHYNVGHALFDGLYPAYVAVIRFPPRHLYPFRILAGINDDCTHCWTEDIYSRFGGLGILKHGILNKMSREKWYVFEELIMGSGTLCQRCTQPNLQLPGGVELDGSRLFRDRMYRQHSLIPPIKRIQSSSEYRTSRDVLLAYVIHNKRFTRDDQKEINDAIKEMNNYTNMQLNKSIKFFNKEKWPLIRVTYLYYNKIQSENLKSIKINATSIDSRSPIYELIENNFMAQLKILRQMDIHISGPGTGQMYQTFLSDGSIHINLGGIIKPKLGKPFASYLEQHMTSGAPYIKGLYYPINERTKGIKKNEVIKLIRQAAKLILEGFHLPVNPRENLAPDGQLFVEMCEKDKTFCSLVTTRSSENYGCLDLWVEDFVHENRLWKSEGFIQGGRNKSCPFNHTLLHQLREKYGIKHN